MLLYYKHLLFSMHGRDIEVLKWILMTCGWMTTGFTWLREGKVECCRELCSMDLVSSYFDHMWNLIVLSPGETSRMCFVT
jgi:hypothetical protein